MGVRLSGLACMCTVALLPVAFLLGSLSARPGASEGWGRREAAHLHLTANLTLAGDGAAGCGGSMGEVSGAHQGAQELAGRPAQPAAASRGSRQLSDAWRRQIEAQLAPLQRVGGVTRERIARAAGLKDWKQARVLIHNNALFIRPYPESSELAHPPGQMPHYMLQHLLKALCRYRLPDMELVINLADRPTAPKGGGGTPPLPIFSWCTTAGHWDISLPYFTFTDLPISEQRAAWPPLLTPAAWAAKQGGAFWRGSSTGWPQGPKGSSGPPGGEWNASNWRQMPRYQLVAACRERPDLCDAQLTGFVQLQPAAEAALRAEMGLHPRTPFSRSFRYRYVVVVDGNTATAARTKDSLLRDSLLLWQQTEYQEFWYAGLRPYVHYLPLSEGLEDLHARIEWAQRNQAAAQEMVLAAQQFGRQHFHSEAVVAYVAVLLKEYAKLMRYKPQPDEAYRRGRVHATRAQLTELINRTGLGSCPHLRA